MGFIGIIAILLGAFAVFFPKLFTSYFIKLRTILKGYPIPTKGEGGGLKVTYINDPAGGTQYPWLLRIIGIIFILAGILNLLGYIQGPF